MIGPSRPAIIAAWRARLPDPTITGRPAILAALHRLGWRRDDGSPLEWSDVRRTQGLYFRPGFRRKGEPTTTWFLVLLWAIEHGKPHGA